MKRARRWRAMVLGLGLALGAVQVQAPAHAQASLDFALAIEGEPACSDALALQEAIEARVGGLVFTDDPRAARRIALRVTKLPPETPGAPPAWSAAIAMRDASERVVGERQVRVVGEACSALDEALIVVLTTMIGIADASVRPAPPEPEPVASQPKPPPAPPSPAPEPASAPLEVDVHLGVLARAEVGFLPGLAPGAALFVGFDLGAAVLSLGVSALPYAVEDLGAGARAQFAGGGADASLCLEAGQPFGATFDFCAGAQAAAVYARTTGLFAGVSRLDPVVRALVAARVRAPLGRTLGILASLEAAAPLAFPRYFFIEASGGRRYYHSVELGIGVQIGIYWML